MLRQIISSLDMFARGVIMLAFRKVGWLQDVWSLKVSQEAGAVQCVAAWLSHAGSRLGCVCIGEERWPCSLLESARA